MSGSGDRGTRRSWEMRARGERVKSNEPMGKQAAQAKRQGSCSPRQHQSKVLKVLKTARLLWHESSAVQHHASIFNGPFVASSCGRPEADRCLPACY